MHRILEYKHFLNSLVIDEHKEITNIIQSASEEEIKAVTEVVQNFRSFDSRKKVESLYTQIKTQKTITNIRNILKKNCLLVRCLVATLLSIML